MPSNPSSSFLFCSHLEVVVVGYRVRDINQSLPPNPSGTMFTPVSTSLGALMLYQGSSGLLFHNGAVFGISSLVSGCVFNPDRDNVPIVAGLVSSILPVWLLAPSLMPTYPLPPQTLAAAAETLGVGFLLGWGTKVRNA